MEPANTVADQLFAAGPVAVAKLVNADLTSLLRFEAGDTMTAGVVDGLWRAGVTGPGATERLQGLGPARWQEVLEFGVRAAAVTVSRPGADPPRRDELG